jgi:superfamily II DNA or RNA helicase
MENPRRPGAGITGAETISLGSGSLGHLAHASPTAQLRPYQANAIEQYHNETAAARSRILLVADTGAGKTVIAAAVIVQAVQAGRRVLFLAHRRELIKQASRKLHAAGCDHGILLSGYTARPGKPVQVASIATLHARAVRSNIIDLPPADLIVVDEAHHVRARTYARVIQAYPGVAILGLTATPCRGDGRGLGNVFQTIIQCPSVADLITAGHLVPTVVYAPWIPDLRGVRVERGDYVESQLAKRMDQPKLVGDIVEHWLHLAERRPTVVFATNVAHSLHIRDEFRRANVLAEHVDGNTPLDERDAILARLAAGDVEVVCNVMLLIEGWDQPCVSCIVLARPTKSLGLFRQIGGRGLRPAPGKVNCLILDHAGATFEHGFVEDPIAWSLSEDRRADNRTHAARGTQQVPRLTACPECSAVISAGKPCCACGWRPPRKAEAVEVADGELGHVARDRSVRANTYTADEKTRFHKGLLWIAEEKHYNPGWAAHKYREKFGVWPRAKPDPEPPDPAVRAWVRSRQIAYAKAKATASRQ